MKRIIKKIYEISAPIEQVWRALVDSKIIDEWGGGPSVMNEKIGTEFQLWGGDIHGKNIEVIKGKKLVQEWFEGDWPNPSIVKFILRTENSQTILELEHTSIPDKDINDIDRGWDDYYLGPIKEMLEKNLIKDKNR
jgi:activator of HSP90 ATPase